MALPQPDLEFTTEPFWSLLRTEFPSKLDTALRHPKKVNRYRLLWPNATPAERDQIRAEFDLYRGGAGSFQFTPPGGTARAGHFVSDSLLVEYATEARMAVSLEIEEEVWP